MATRQFQLYNSMTKQKEIFMPKEPGKVRIYVGGVPAYDLSHIGHARAYVAVDILYRYLQHLGYQVTYVRKFADIDDKLIKLAEEVGEEPLGLSKRFCDEYLTDMRDLNVLVPTEQLRVSENMDEIKKMIGEIMRNDYTYAADGDVYFSADKCPAYGPLSKQKPEDNLAGASEGVQDTLAATKQSQNDFALWKAAKPGEISWESPGRPGGHIECSAMGDRYHTSSFDIHGGGMDLRVPHHENELAQSCAAWPNTCEIKYWMHNCFVDTNNEQQPHSFGNLSTIREITKLYHPLALRYLMASTHYRSPVNYSLEKLELASLYVSYIYKTLLNCEKTREENPVRLKCKDIQPTPEAQKCIVNLKNEFRAKMSDDLQTPDLLSAGAFKKILILMHQIKKIEQQDHSLFMSLVEMEKEVKMVLDTLGLMSSSSYSEVLRQFKVKALTRAKLTERDVLRHIEISAQAREDGNSALSDQIRRALTDKGVFLYDLEWRPCFPNVRNLHSLLTENKSVTMIN